MSNPNSLWKKTLAAHLWREFRTRWRFKYQLPKVTEACLEGVRLDVSKLSPVMKNNLLEGRYEVQERALAAKAVLPGDAVLELGGAIGFIGLYCQMRLGVTRYTTVEANPETAELLKRNYALNGRTANLLNVAVGREDGRMTFHVGGEFWENSAVAGRGRSIEVPALSFSTLIAGLECLPDVLIIDIEGAESFIDFRSTPPTVRVIIMEIHPAFIGFPAAYKIVAEILNLGFRVEEEMGGTYLFSRA